MPRPHHCDMSMVRPREQLLRIHEDAVARRFHLAGELDLSTAHEVAGAIEALPPDGDVVLDVSQLQFMDVTGLRALVQSSEYLRGTLIVDSPTRVVSRMIELTPLGRRGNLRVVRRGSPAN